MTLRVVVNPGVPSLMYRWSISMRYAPVSARPVVPLALVTLTRAELISTGSMSW